MKQIIFTTILIFALCFAASAHEYNFPSNYLFMKSDEYVIFDEYENINIKDEKERLNSLSRKIAEDKTLKGFIVLRLAKNESKKKKIKRLRTTAKHFAVRKVDKTRFSLAIFDDERTKTVFYVEPETVDLSLLLPNESRNHKIIKAEDLEQQIKELFPIT